MLITRNMTIKEVNLEFSRLYPHLKLCFYKSGHGHFVGSSPEDEYSEDTILSEINPDMSDGNLPHFGEMTVEEFESNWKSIFGLNVQVFRKSGDVWLQTSKTDFWTLNKQEFKAQ